MNNRNKLLLLFFISCVLCNYTMYSQGDYTKYAQMVKIGDQIFEDVLKGDFSYFNQNESNEYPLDSANIVSYKQDLANHKLGIKNLRSIEMANNDSLFFYQMVVFHAQSNSPVTYYFVVGLMFYDDSPIELVNHWIITENSSFRQWWQHTMGFYRSEDFKQLPQEFKYEICPPPPDHK